MAKPKKHETVTMAELTTIIATSDYTALRNMGDAYSSLMIPETVDIFNMAIEKARYRLDEELHLCTNTPYEIPQGVSPSEFITNIDPIEYKDLTLSRHVFRSEGISPDLNLRWQQ